MSSKELPKKIILAILSFIFFTFAPLAINTYLIGQIGVKNTITNVVEGFATETFSSSLNETCGRQKVLTYADCEALALEQSCPQYAGEASCNGVGAKGKDYFIRNMVLPNTISKISDAQIPKTNIKIGDLDALVNNLFVISTALTLISAILMTMLIATPKNVLNILGTNIVLVGLPMFAFAYLANIAMPSLIAQASKDLANQEAVTVLSGVVTSSLKPLFDSQIQIGILLTVLGLIAVAASKIFFKNNKFLHK